MTKPLASTAIPVVVLNDTRVDRHHGCSRVMSALETLIAEMGGRIIASAPAHSDWTQSHQVLEALEKAKLVVVNGEGTIHHNSKAGLKLLEVAEHAARLGIPCVLLNCAWQDNGLEFVEKLRQFTLVSVRDTRSAAQIRAAGISCCLVPDLSLYSPCNDPSLKARSRVGFTDSVMRPVSVALEQARQACHGLSMPIQFAKPGVSGTYRFFRESVAKTDIFHPDFLAAMLGLRLQQYRSQSFTAQAYIDRLAELELLVSGRFHACTLAMVARTPFVAVSSNSHKIEALISDAGLAPWRLMTEMTPDAIAHARQAGWARSEAVALDDFLLCARQSAQALFKDIGKLL